MHIITVLQFLFGVDNRAAPSLLNDLKQVILHNYVMLLLIVALFPRTIYNFR